MILQLTQVLVYVLILARLVGLILYAPIYSDRRIFTMGRIAVIIWISGLIMFVVPLPDAMPESNIAYVLALAAEILVGALIGFTTDLMISAIEFGGALMDTQAGLSVANLLDPANGQQRTLFALMLKWTSIMIFLTVNGHHMVMTVIMESFAVLPLGAPVAMVKLSEGCLFLAKIGYYVFSLGVKLAAPIILVVFLIDFGFGMLNKVAEQVNIFQLGFQIKPTVSLIIFLAIVPGMTDSIFRVMEQITEHILRLFHSLQA
ncbi:MAG: flagellar biosynthetic protein FliR [bacterium]|nr:flagellar biosynthetic protein FliR [bacterium]